MRMFRTAAVVAMGLTLAPWIAISASAAQSQATKAVNDASPNSIPAEDQATREQVERLFQVMRIRQQMELVISQMSTMMKRQISDGMKKEQAALPDDKKITTEQSAVREQLINKFMDRAAHLYSVDEILADITPIYQRHISKSDIEAFIAFFGSTAGQHLLDQQPLIANEYMPLVMTRVSEKTKTLTEDMKKDMDALNAKKHPDTKSSSPQ